eukprot:PhF_6_TR22007/c0_g1_i1/m.31273
MNPPQPPTIPGLPPMPPIQLVLTSEKLSTILDVAGPMCFKQCVGYFSEDSIPYHYGERTCMERCADKLYDSFHMARGLRHSVEAKIKAGVYTPSWLSDIQKEAEASAEQQQQPVSKRKR